MKKVKIVTDSAQDFAPELLLKQGIRVVPLTVHFGDESYLDGYELRGKAFYDLLRTSPHHPRTSQPSPAAFMEVFDAETKDGSQVIAITLSSGLSGTYQSAVLARSELPDRDIAVVDSKTGSGGYGLIAMAANEMALSGEDPADILSEVLRMRDEMVMFFAVDTLDYLARNGRIGRAKHLLGSLLKVKPILTVDKEGMVTSADQVRGKSRVIPRIVELVKSRIPEGEEVDVTITNAENPEEAAKMLQALEEALNVRKAYGSEIGAIIGTHTGPGAMAVFVVPVGK